MTLASPVLAQSTVTRIRDLNDRIDDIQTGFQADMGLGKDAERFAPLNVPQGWPGSLAFSTSSTDGNANAREAALDAGMRDNSASSAARGFGMQGHVSRHTEDLPNA